MPTREEMEGLVQAHVAIEDEPLETAIWIRGEQPDVAWLVEVLPKFESDPRAEEPIHFTAGRGFRYPLRLIAGNEADIRAAIKRDKDLAVAVAAGEVLHGEALGIALKEFAKSA